MTLKTKYGGVEYTYAENGRRARLTKAGVTIWWGTPGERIPAEIPTVVLLQFSVMKEEYWK